jgi:GNAT superfamily N-acetyltransferase
VDEAFLVGWSERNVRQHFVELASRLPESRVHDRGAYVIVDTGLASDALNIVFGAERHGLTSADVTNVLTYFAERRLPFTWWLGPSHLWAGEALCQEGLALVGIEAGMAAPVERLAPVGVAFGGEVRRASRTAEVLDHARIRAGHRSPADEALVAFYRSAAKTILRADSDRHLLVLYLKGEPVSTAELCVSGAVAGLYGVATRPDLAGRGYGTTVVAAALRLARDTAGVETIVLQANPRARRFFSRLGFDPIGEFHGFTAELGDREWAG